MSIGTTDVAETDRATCPFNHHDPSFRYEYRQVIDGLREAAPIAWSDLHGGFWVVTSYELVRQLARDSETFTVAPGPDRTGGLRIPPTPGMKTRPLFVPGETDGVEHDVYRMALNPHFSKARVAELAPMIERHVHAALDAVVERDEFDAIGEFIIPILAGVGSEHLGIDVADPADFFHSMHRMIGSTGAVGAEFEEVRRTFDESWATLTDLVDRRRAEPGDDVISHLISHTDPVFADEQIHMMTLNVILGAFHTTSSLLGQILLHLSEHPEVREHLRAHPDEVPRAVDEFLRHKAVSIGIARTATKDVEVGGASIKQGDRVMLVLAGANYDPAKYANPTEFDLERGSAQHLAMGVGAHFCLGAWLAKSVAATTIREMLARVDHFAIDPARIQLADEISNAYSIEHAPATAIGR
ncbi:MAG: cytochrome P450 [Desertimonas sp.]